MVLDLGGEVQDERPKNASLLRSAQVFEGMWELNGMLKEPMPRLGYRIDRALHFMN